MPKSSSLLARGAAMLMMLVGCTPTPKPTATKNERWVAYYDVKEPIGFFADYDLVVFDAKHYVDFTSLKPKTTVLAYLSFGEENGFSEDLPELQAAGAVVRKNPNWPAYIMDIRHEVWRKKLLEERIPAIIAKGFDGLMLDTIESPVSLDNATDKRYFGLHAACVSLIKEIHEKFPQLKLMQNRAFPLLHETPQTLIMCLQKAS